MRFGGHCKRYRIFCNAYRKICRPYSGKAMRFPSSAPPCRFSLRGRRRSRFWRENSRCWQGVQFFHTARPQDSEAIQKAPGAASVGAIYAAVNAMNQLGRVHTTVRPIHCITQRHRGATPTLLSKPKVRCRGCAAVAFYWDVMGPYSSAVSLYFSPKRRRSSTKSL